MRKAFIVIGLLVFLGGMTGCQNGILARWRNANQPVTYCSAAPVVVEDECNVCTDPCNTGCSCATGSLPSSSSIQTYSPAPAAEILSSPSTTSSPAPAASSAPANSAMPAPIPAQ